jgi:hypothetical protein
VRKALLTGLLLGGLLLGLLSALSATTIIPISVERLTDISTDVVAAHANKSWSSWNAQHTMIVTYTEFSVDSRLKGSVPATITVKQPGGSAGDYTQHVAGVRPWSAGESAVLFLRPSSSGDGCFVVSGLMQGDFRVRKQASGAVVVDNGSGNAASQSEQVQSFNASDKSLTPFSGSRMTLDQLQKRVRSRMQAR